MIEGNLALFNVDQLVTLAPDSHPSAQGPLGVIERAALVALDDHIVWVGPMSELDSNVELRPDATVLNTHGRTVLPGFVDPHTHPVFGGSRVNDFYRRALGESYAEQLDNDSGGIMETVRQTRAKSEEALLDLAYQRADTFLRQGVTTIEAKSGYGLTLEDELKSLRVLNRLQRIHPLKIVPAFLGAHVVPDDFPGSTDDYTDHVVAWLPEVQNHARLVDVWFEEPAFTKEQGSRILRRAQELGLSLTAHANELGPHGGARAAAELGARSVDHVVYLDDGDIEALKRNDAVAVLLPGTTFFLASDTFAPARALLDAGVTVALGTDFNPGTSYTQNMLFILTLAVLKLKMTPEEAIQAATVNAAKAVGLEDHVGTLEPGKCCDFTVFCVGDYRELPYFYAMNLVEFVVAGGHVVVQEGQIVDTPNIPALAPS